MIEPVKAITMKELRENLPWAGLIFLITFGGLAAGLYNHLAAGMSILGEVFLILCTVMYPAAGLALGLLQGFGDARKGRWQFVSHRPVSRSVLLGTKVAVGIGLYLLGALLPLLIVIAWVATPGHVPGPFAWDMTEPALAYLLWGLIWYAAGLMVAVRKASWFASRLLPLGAAVAGSFASYVFAWTLSESILITLMSAAAILVGVFGLFQHDGETSRSPLWAKPSIGVSVLIGWVLVLFVGMGFGDALIREIFSRPNQEINYSYYQVADNGQMQIWTQNGTSNAVQKAEDLAGHPVKLPPNDHWYNNGIESVSLQVADPLTESSLRPFPGIGGFLDPKSHVVQIQNSQPNWFFLLSSRTIVEYDQKSARAIGRLGPHGFAAANDSAEAFPPNTSHVPIAGSQFLLVNEGGVSLIDLWRKSIVQVYVAAPGNSIVAAAASTLEAYKVPSTQPGFPFTVVATRNFLHIVPEVGQQVTIPIDHAYLNNRVRSVQVDRLPNGGFQVDYGTNYGVGYAPVNVSDYDSTGKLLTQTLVPVARRDRSDSNWDLEGVGALTLSPPAFFATVLFLKRDGNQMPVHAVLLLVGTAIGFGVIAYAMLGARHARESRKVLWIVLAMALGMSGIALLVFMLEKPRFVRCRRCGKRRLLSESACPNCNTPADGPAMEGIEILECGNLVAG